MTGHHSSYLFDEPKIVIGRVGAYCGAVHLDQSLDLQEDALKVGGCGRIFTDVASGSTTERPGLAECLDDLQRVTRWWCGGSIDSADPHATSSRP